VASPTSPNYEDVGLTNGVTVFYVVTAQDARFESVYSSEVAATPTAAPGVIPAEIRLEPDRLPAECLLSTCQTDDDDDDDDDDDPDPHAGSSGRRAGGGKRPRSIDPPTVRPGPGQARLVYHAILTWTATACPSLAPVRVGPGCRCSAE
jgi:hypothetical protein